VSVTTVHVDQPPEALFAVLADPWRYAEWVVGAKKVRDVDAHWPQPGSRFHHRVGVGPLTIDDSTVVEEIEPPRRMVLRARARPAGVARVTIELTPAGAGTEVTMTEVPIAGPARWLDNPILEAAVDLRNRRSLRRLAELAARQPRTGSAP
jgi:uncharacterized protein YndB with AHSA1/START domain